MSHIDAYEYERPRWRKRKPYQTKKKNHKREVQLSMKLYGGTTVTEKDKGAPFDDDISHIGKP